MERSFIVSSIFCVNRMLRIPIQPMLPSMRPKLLSIQPMLPIIEPMMKSILRTVRARQIGLIPRTAMAPTQLTALRLTHD